MDSDTGTKTSYKRSKYGGDEGPDYRTFDEETGHGTKTSKERYRKAGKRGGGKSVGAATGASTAPDRASATADTGSSSGANASQKG